MKRFVAMLAALAFVPLMMAPSGGFPSRPIFQSVGIGGSAPAGTGAQTNSGTGPRYDLNETDAAANNRVWQIAANNAQWRFRVADDALATVSNAIEVDRSGTTVTGLILGNGTDLPIVTTQGTLVAVNSPPANGQIQAKGAAASASNVSYLGFVDSAGTRTGYVGDNSAGDSVIALAADTAGANIRLIPGSGGTAQVGSTNICLQDGTNCANGAVVTYAFDAPTNTTTFNSRTANASTWTMASCGTGCNTVTMTGVNCSTAVCIAVCQSTGSTVIANSSAIGASPGVFNITTFTASTGAAVGSASVHCSVTKQ